PRPHGRGPARRRSRRGLPRAGRDEPAARAPPRRALQGHRLHRRHRARARGGALVRRPRGHRGRPEGPRHPRPPGPPAEVKALLVRQSSIGDVIHVLPALAALHARGWETASLCEPGARAVLEKNPALTTLVPVPPRRAFAFGGARQALA